MIKKIYILVFCTSFLLTNCGFKVIDSREAYKFDIIVENISGDNKINYILRNKLKQNNSGNKKEIILTLETNKQKQISEKNIKNEITKYNIIINVKVKYKTLVSDDEKELLISKSGVYGVEEQFSRTIQNEKKLIQFLTKEISSQIIDNLSSQINDF